MCIKSLIKSTDTWNGEHSSVQMSNERSSFRAPSRIWCYAKLEYKKKRRKNKQTNKKRSILLAYANETSLPRSHGNRGKGCAGNAELTSNVSSFLEGTIWILIKLWIKKGFLFDFFFYLFTSIFHFFSEIKVLDFSFSSHHQIFFPSFFPFLSKFPAICIYFIFR